MEWIKCPYCGHKINVSYSKGATSSGIFVRCKGKNCRQIFEIKVYKGKIK